MEQQMLFAPQEQLLELEQHIFYIRIISTDSSGNNIYDESYIPTICVKPKNGQPMLLNIEEYTNNLWDDQDKSFVFNLPSRNYKANTLMIGNNITCEFIEKHPKIPRHISSEPFAPSALNAQRWIVSHRGGMDRIKTRLEIIKKKQLEWDDTEDFT